MSKVDQGGQAYPESHPYDEQPGWRRDGMTLRDYFIGQAIAGLNLEEWIDRVESDESCDSSKAYGMIAKHCMGVADAIIARKRVEENSESQND